MIVRRIRPEEVKRTEELFAVAFETPYTEERDAGTLFEEKSMAPKSREDVFLMEKYAAFEEDDRTMMSCLSATRFPMQFDGNHVLMAGIGGVSSLPQYRRRGGIRGCFETMLPDLYQHEVVFSYLYPFSTAYYRKFGYEMGASGRTYDLKLEYLPVFPVQGECELVDEANRGKLLTEIQSVYRSWQERYNCMICNELWEFQFVTQAEPYGKQEYVWLYRGEDKTPKAYMVYRKERCLEQQVLICSRMVFADSEGWKGLMNLAKTMASDHTRIIFTLPQDQQMENFLREFSFGACKMEDKSLGMLRVINVEKSLTFAAYRGDGELTLKVNDPYILQNNAVFYVKFQNGKAIEVSKAEKENSLPQLELPISEFSRLITGCAQSTWLDQCEEIKVSAKETAAGKVFYKKPCFLMEYF